MLLDPNMKTKKLRKWNTPVRLESHLSHFFPLAQLGLSVRAWELPAHLHSPLWDSFIATFLLLLMYIHKLYSWISDILLYLNKWFALWTYKELEL